MKHILPYLSQHQRLSKEAAYELLLAMTRGELNDAQMAGILTAFIMRPMSVEELMGFREALLELRKPVKFKDAVTIDLCGTGGDGKNSFNISTLSAVVVAASGHKVVKHGNYGVSSLCGSSNVLESWVINSFQMKRPCKSDWTAATSFFCTHLCFIPP